MPKNKKQKTNHKTGANGDLSQAEIWDDSALIRSWNDAVAEYEYYHSIHARGEDVDEVLRQAELAEQVAANGKLESATKITYHDDGGNSASEEGEIDDDYDHHDDGEEPHAQNEHDSSNIDRLVAKVDDEAAKTMELSTTNPPGSTTRLVVQDQHPSYQPGAHQRQQQTNDNPHSSAEGEAAAVLPVDQTLENIKMAYYWAGYYSGLYEGQKQAAAQGQKER